MKLVRIVAPHFVAAVAADSVVRECAPILSYMAGWKWAVAGCGTTTSARGWVRSVG